MSRCSARISGFRPRPPTPDDLLVGTLLRRLGLRRSKAESALVVPVPAAESFLRRFVPESPGGFASMPAHLTVVYPFLPPSTIDDSVESTVGEIAARFGPFTFQLTRTGRFRGVLYLEPEPAFPFVTLTEAIVDRWPEQRPYGGRYPRLVPHVTVLAGPEPPGLAAALEDALPLECTAAELHVMVQDDGGRWRAKRQVLLGARPPSGPVHDR